MEGEKRESDLSTGYEPNRRRVDRVPFSGNQEDFPRWDYRFRIYAARLGCGPLLVRALDTPDAEKQLIDDTATADLTLLELLAMSCDGAAGDILQFEMLEPTGRSAWLRIQSRYAGSTSIKIGSMYIDLFRPVAVTNPDQSIAAINRWFAGWKFLKALNHELKLEAIFAVSEIYLPSQIFSISISQIKVALESGAPYDVPKLMDRLRQVAVDASVKADQQASGSEAGFFVGPSRSNQPPKKSKPHTSSAVPGGHRQPSSTLKCSFCSATGHLEDKCYKKHGDPGHSRKTEKANQAQHLPPVESVECSDADIRRYLSRLMSSSSRPKPHEPSDADCWMVAETDPLLDGLVSDNPEMDSLVTSAILNSSHCLPLPVPAHGLLIPGAPVT